MLKMIKLLKRTIQNINNLDAEIRFSAMQESLLTRIFEFQPALTTSETNGPQVIASLTTYGRRIDDVHLVIESIGRQSQQANRIILWLDEEEFSLANLPSVLKMQMARGLEVRFCENLRSYKKLVPTVQTFPNDHVITFDDDILYPIDTIEKLMQAHQKNPRAIIGHRAHQILISEQGDILPYLSWKLSLKTEQKGHGVFITTGAGTLFPAGILPEMALDKSLFNTLCPRADDIWFKVIALKHNIDCIVLGNDIDYEKRFLFIPHSQFEGLSIGNVHSQENDRQLAAALASLEVDIAIIAAES